MLVDVVERAGGTHSDEYGWTCGIRVSSHCIILCSVYGMSSCLPGACLRIPRAVREWNNFLSVQHDIIASSGTMSECAVTAETVPTFAAHIMHCGIAPAALYAQKVAQQSCSFRTQARRSTCPVVVRDIVAMCVDGVEHGQGDVVGWSICGHSLHSIRMSMYSVSSSGQAQTQ